jgi:hypothetical protein
MEIKLDNEWSILDDGRGYILRKDTGKLNKDGTKIYDDCYPATLNQAVTLWARRTLAEKNEVVSMKRYVEMMDEKLSEIRTALQLKVGDK